MPLRRSHRLQRKPKNKKQLENPSATIPVDSPEQESRSPNQDVIPPSSPVKSLEGMSLGGLDNLAFVVEQIVKP